ncbi:MAG: HAMP domain-containing histidine kinase [Lachnospira sp.]|nr:HAMP domain-containing histidine kinase [Lachnospira sp.]
MGIVRITEEDVKKNVRNYRIKQTFFVLGVMAVSVIIIVSLIVYYNIKQRALVGALYLSDENSAVQLVNNLMYLNINKYTLQAGSDAMLEAGYSAKGYTYLLRINGELVSYIVIALILAVILIYGLISCYKIGKKDYMGQIKLIAGKNVSLKEELNKEQEYNKIQYKKMQEFVENIAHQIKTPLSVITMKLEMIQELCGINEDICRLITDCTKNTFKIKMFIKKLLDISRIESGKITLSSDEIVIDYIVEESVECSVDDKQKVSVNYGNEDRHRKMYADEGWLLEALINVISNCYEHINQKKGGMVYIDISSNSEVCMITISDNGDGIQDCDVAGIFDRFMSRKSQDEFHAGIGLNLSKLIIEAHHGNISAGNSDKYGGAQFKIILPLYKFKGKL